MNLRPNILLAGLATAALGLSVAAHAADKPTPGRQCFLSRDWDGWSAPGKGDVIYLRVRAREIWRVDLAPGSHVHKDPGYFLVNRVRGSSWICSPLDLSLTLSDRHGFRQGLIAKRLRKLTPAEVAAIPRKDLP